MRRLDVESLQLFIITVMIVAVAIGFAWFLATIYYAERAQVDFIKPVDAYVDIDGDVLICLYNAGPEEHLFKMVVLIGEHRARVYAIAKIGEITELRTRVGGEYTAGVTVAGDLVDSRGRRYRTQFVVVNDVEKISCG